MSTATKAEVVEEAGQRRTALDVFAERVAASGGGTALRHKVDGRWRTVSWSDWDTAATEIAAGLRALGVETGDRVLLLANTRVEWAFCDVGVMRAGAVVVPSYPSNTPDQVEYIVSDSGSVVVIAEDPHQLEKLASPEVRSRIGQVRQVVLMSDVASLERPDRQGRSEVRLADVLPDDAGDWVSSLDELRTRGRAWLEGESTTLGDVAQKLDPEQAATIVYTSGTTGPPKGVVLTHKNMAFECAAVQDLLDLGPDDEQLLFLPLAHMFARILEWAAITVGCVTSFAESLPKLIANMGEVRPTFMGAVPRVYEKAYAKIQASFDDKRKKPVTRVLIDWALKKGAERSQRQRAGHAADGFGVRLADRLVFEKVRATFGGRLRFFISGGAPLSAEIAEFFHGAGILVLEGYGLTECTAASHINRPGDFEFGTVGPALPGVEVTVAPDGEILLRGDNIMKCYYGQPEATAEVIDGEGWFHTGDIGVIEDSGHLRITDRKKDIIVTAGGKNVAPQNIEGAFKAMCPLASQMMVYGDKRKYLSALITLNEEALMPWAQEKGLSGSYAELTQNDTVRAEIQRHVDQLNAGLASYETIKKFAILERDFDQESGELTPTLKVKRKHCTEAYRDVLEGFYRDAAS